MNVLFFDPYHGAAGDMIVGALLDLGAPLERLAGPLERMLPGAFTLGAERVKRGGIRATQFRVHLTESSDAAGHPRRHLKDVLELIDRADLSDWVRQTAHGCFQRLAEVEAAIHGTTPERVHFHEVGAVDSIVDTVGALLAVEALGPERIYSAPVALGRGVTACEHGTLPLPVPATAALLQGFLTRPAAPDRPDLVDLEMCTPTGAMLLTALAEPVAAMPAMRPERIGCGAGTREDPGIANLIRAVWGRTDEAAAPPARGASATAMIQIECVIDDMPAELMGFLFERLHGAGAVEVTTQAVGLKKSRPGVLLSVLLEPSLLEHVRDAIFAETTTFGMRYFPVERFVLDRRHVAVETPWGPVGVKLGLQGGRTVTASPEYEDCRKIAEQKGVALREVYAAAIRASQGLERGE